MPGFDSNSLKDADYIAIGAAVITFLTLLVLILQVQRAKEQVHQTEEQVQQAKEQVQQAKEQVRQTREVERARFLQNLMNQLILDADFRKFWLRVDYWEFTINWDKGGNPVFESRDEEFWLDGLLYIYDFVGYLLKGEIITIDEVKVIGFSPSRVLISNPEVKRYLAWLARDFAKEGIEERPHHYAHYLAERFDEEKRKKREEPPQESRRQTDAP